VLGCGTWFFPIEEQLYYTDIEQVLREKKPFILRCML
jgi:hypothetical protein